MIYKLYVDYFVSKIKEKFVVSKISKIVLLLFVNLLAASSLADRVDKIIISGNDRVEKSTIQEYLGIDAGDDYTEAEKSKAVKRLYATSLFEKISLKYNKGVLKLNVVENYFIS
ncbi:MAG: hypothetical protein DGJ47_000277, partial [Rickettsiaceae bacterium]